MNIDSTSPWRQVNMTGDDWRTAESIAASRLGPLLAEAEQHRVITSWWYTRKGPQWLIRCMPAPGKNDEAAALLREAMDGLRERGDIEQWVWGMYEPEIHPFGGVEAMNVAYDLFHTDSRNILHYLHQLDDRLPGRDHRRELGLMLASTLLRGAGLDWYEQGDVWAQVAAHRGQPHQTPPDRQHALETNLRQLMSVDATMRDGTPLAFAATWSAAFANAGRELAGLAADGRLHRGLRAVLAHHVVFAWNRIGLPYTTQAVLAHAAKNVVFGIDPTVHVADETRNERT